MTSDVTPKTHLKYLSTKQVCERFGNISSRTLTRWQKERNFPMPYSSEGISNMYLISEIESWEEEHLTQLDAA